jgi:hypothetical protein
MYMIICGPTKAPVFTRRKHRLRICCGWHRMTIQGRQVCALRRLLTFLYWKNSARGALNQRQDKDFRTAIVTGFTHHNDSNSGSES